MALNPVGPLPASTYWRRRAVLLLGVIVVLLLLKSCAGGGDAPKKDALSGTPKPTATTAPEKPVAPKPTAAAPTKAAEPPVTASPLCTDAQLMLTATTDASTYGPGATPKITLSVKNTSATACRRDLGAGVVELQVFSGPDRIWSSDDCSPSKASALELLAPGASQAVVKTWPGRRSTPQCTGSQPTAAPGTYVVMARLGTLKQSSSSFTIHS
jgi:hypothetical protein